VATREVLCERRTHGLEAGTNLSMNSRAIANGPKHLRFVRATVVPREDVCGPRSLRVAHAAGTLCREQIRLAQEDFAAAGAACYSSLALERQSRRSALAELVRSMQTAVMPSVESILAGLTSIANEWRSLAAFWHAYIAALLLAIAVRRDLSARLIGTLLVLPLLSVSALAWIGHNPFNAAVCAALSLVLLTIARGVPDEPLPIAPWPLALAGGALVAFGWTYPHFVDTTHWALYLVVAPLGLVPCPTLTAMIGLTLILRGLRSTAWNVTLAGAALLYAVIGVFWLGVTIDLVLLAGATTLVAATALRSEPLRPIRT
jgi:hypothetical protein